MVNQISRGRSTRPLLARVERLQRLAVFEAAARLGSFSAAGRELGMAQPAVTRHIRALERALGVDLFDRSANRAVLNAVGTRLAAATDSGFGTIEDALDELDGGDDVLVLAVLPGFAQQLVVPRLDDLQAALGDPDVHLALYDRERDLDAHAVDATVRVGVPPWPGTDHRRLFGEAVVPVASPGLAAELGLDADSTVDDLVDAPLLHMDADDRPWVSWSDWFGHLDRRPGVSRRRTIVNNYPTVLEQALAGRGVALGWRGIVDRLLDDGLLVVVGPEVRTDRSYCITWPHRRSGPAVDRLVDWMVGEMVGEVGDGET